MCLNLFTLNYKHLQVKFELISNLMTVNFIVFI